MDNQLLKQIRTNFPKSSIDTIVVGAETSAGMLSFLDCILSSAQLLKTFGIRAICFQDSCLDWKMSEVSTLLQTMTRVARAGVLDGICVYGRFFSNTVDVSADVFRSFSTMVASFRAVNLANVGMPQRYFNYILGAITTSTSTVRVNIDGVKVEADESLRSKIKTSSGAVGVSNSYSFLLEIAKLLSAHVPVDLWNSGWVFQEAQRMVVYVLSNSVVTTMPADVGARLFIRACAFVLDMQSGTDTEILRSAVRQCESAADEPGLSVIIGVVQSEAGFLPGPVQSTFGLSPVPDRYLSFHQTVIRPEVMRTIDTRSGSEVRTWLDVATLPFVFAHLCRTKVVTGSNVDELLTWALEL